METASSLAVAAFSAIDAAKADLNDISQMIWKNPELCFEEHNAYKNLTDFLSRYGFTVERHFLSDTGFKIVYGSGSPTVAILCEYDALPEIGHACGHNLIAEVGVAASIGIKAAIDESGGTLGTLVVLGTPAEESGGGKFDFVDQGVFDDVDCAMMAHPFSYNITKPTLIAARECHATFNGKASHAASAPWEGVNALDAAVMAYNGLSCLRQQMKPTCRLHAIIKRGGVKTNIIPDNTKLEYQIRAPTLAELQELKGKVSACIESAAVATGCKVEDVSSQKQAYADMIHNNTLCDVLERKLNEFGVEYVTTAKGVPSASTDMGNVSYVVPSIHPLFAIGTDAFPHTSAFTEAAGRAEAQPNTLTYGKALAMVAIDVMSDPKLMAQVKEDFRRDMDKSKYHATFNRKVSHAASAPWEGVNALDAAVMAYNDLSCLRQQMKPTWRLHAIIKRGGVKTNIIPDNTKLEYEVRAPTLAELEELKGKVSACIESAAFATGCKVEDVSPQKQAYADMIHNNTLGDVLERKLSEFGIEYVTTAKGATSGSTDMGNVSYVVPSIHPTFHIGTYASVHMTVFAEAAGRAEAQPYTLTYGKALAMVAIDVMSDAKLMEQVKEEFRRDMNKIQTLS